MPILGGTRASVVEDVPAMPADYEPPARWTDRTGRRYDYLRLSVTDRCDLACVYCMPPGGELEHGSRDELLSFEEIARVVAVFANGGVKRVRLSGGEPLVRKDVVTLVERLSRSADVELAMTTNATRLAELAQPLGRAGLRSINISIDSLRPERFAQITRGGDLGAVLAGCAAAREAGMSVKLNIVALGGVNQDEWRSLVEYAWSVGATPRFIELMPLGEGAKLSSSTFASAETVRAELAGLIDPTECLAAAPAHGPATYVVARDGSDRRVGFITALTGNFCDSCNRMRVTAEGAIRACLSSRRAVSLRDSMREGVDDRKLAWMIDWSLAGKDAGHLFTDDDVEEHRHVGMSLIGG